MTRPQKPNENRDRLYANRNLHPPFTSVSFGGWLARRSLRFLENGEMVMSIVVPEANVPDALPVRSLTSNPLPLTINIEVDSSYLGDVEAMEDKLRAL